MAGYRNSLEVLFKGHDGDVGVVICEKIEFESLVGALPVSDSRTGQKGVKIKLQMVLRRGYNL